MQIMGHLSTQLDPLELVNRIIIVATATQYYLRIFHKHSICYIQYRGSFDLINGHVRLRRNNFVYAMMRPLQNGACGDDGIIVY